MNYIEKYTTIIVIGFTPLFSMLFMGYMGVGFYVYVVLFSIPVAKWYYELVRGVCGNF